MGKQVRKIKRKVASDTALLNTLLFGFAKAPTDECDEERRHLVQQFRVAMQSFDTSNAPRFHAYLREAHKSYKADESGGSALMTLLDNVDALRSVEKEERAALAKENAA